MGETLQKELTVVDSGVAYHSPQSALIGAKSQVSISTNTKKNLVAKKNLKIYIYASASEDGEKWVDSGNLRC